MAARLKLEVFDDLPPRSEAPPPGNTSPLPPAFDLAEEKLQSYEQGYKAGWDDATTAHAEEQARISSDFARNLQELSFTYHEAKAQVLAALEPLLTEMVEKVLPKLATESLVEMVVEEVQGVAHTVADAQVELVISPENRAAMERLLEGEQSLPVKLIEEPSLPPGQVFLRFEEIEKQIDLEAVLTRCQEAVDGFFNQTNQEAANG